MVEIDKIVIVTQKTWLDYLIEKYSTKQQAKFYIEHMGGNFQNYQSFHTTYYTSLDRLKKQLPLNQKYQIIERSFLPNFLFGKDDLIVVLGRDGLVINTAKYLEDQLILSINPDPSTIDGILLKYNVDDFNEQLKDIRSDNQQIKKISMAQASLSTKERIIGVNDLFIGNSSHQSARYKITFRGIEEKHSSSGVVISTGIGSTGWLKSILTGALGIVNNLRNLDFKLQDQEYVTNWDANHLYYSVREPWKSKITGSNLTFGSIQEGEEMIIESLMPEKGVIFSDGIESDYVSFTAGTIAKIKLANKKATIMV